MGYPQVGEGARGDPNFDFGKTIGTDGSSGQETPFGTVYSGKKGSHVILANPDKVREQQEEQDDDEDGN